MRSSERKTPIAPTIRAGNSKDQASSIEQAHALFTPRFTVFPSTFNKWLEISHACA